MPPKDAATNRILKFLG